MQRLLMVLAMGCVQTIVRFNGFLSGILTLTVLLLLVIPLWLTFVCCSPRPLRTIEKQSRKVFLGQPRLLATQVSHTRLGVGHYNYTVPHFLVGTPIGLQGRIGSVLSLDEAEIPTQTAGFKQYLNSKTWFTIHAHHHLQKGSDCIGLQGKLHNFLLSQGENPDEWPYAYLVTMPQFLGYQRNLVCFWYLYSASRELTAMVMEVNNYWGQRKIAFSRLTGESPLHPSELSSSVSEESTFGTAVSFQHSNSRYRSYWGTWDKDMFISPFEKAEGSIAFGVSDPLALNASLHITITLLSPLGKPRLIGRVFCPDDHIHLDPLTASSWQLLRFLPYWTSVLVITELLIIAAALRIRSKGAVEFFSMPEVRPNNLPRDETNVERKLESAFRQYLKHIVETSPSPIQLEYIPSKSHNLHPTTFTSPAFSPSSTTTPSLTIQVLAPQFYTSFLSHKDAITAFTEESRPTALPADPSSRRLLISNPPLLFELLSSNTTAKTKTNPKPSPNTSLTTSLITHLRNTPTTHFMDDFVTTHLPPSAQRAYQGTLLTHLLAERVAFGSHTLFGIYTTLASTGIQIAVAYMLFRYFSTVLGQKLGVFAAMVCHWGILVCIYR